MTKLGSRASLALAAGLMTWAAQMPALADPPVPFADFTFKREKPPPSGATRRITVQIAPEEQAGTLSMPAGRDAAAMAPTGERVARHGWFWSRVPAKAGQEPAARLRMAFEALRKGPDGTPVTGPRLQLVQDIAARQGADILRATIGTEVSPALVLAMIAVEAGDEDSAESARGAQGLTHAMPDTAGRRAMADSLSSREKIRDGVTYLDRLLKEFDGDAILALAGYNAGDDAVRQHDGVPPFAETRAYIPRVLAAYQVARNLCKTRPELITDACALDLSMK